MKLTSRMKFALLQRFTINIIFFLLLASIMYFYVYAQIDEIEETKQELHKTFDEYQNITQKGISQGTIRRGALASQRDNFHLQSILSEMGSDFLSIHLANTEDIPYTEFLRKKSTEIQDFMQSEAFTKRDITLDTILPMYSPHLTLSERDISTADFINHIENLLYTFSLNHRGEIGISSIERVDAGDDKQTTETLGENIFQIPVSLTLDGMKGNIVNFLHFMSYVGSASPDIYNNTLIPHNDSFLGGSSEMELFSESRYLGQLASIQNISFNEYIDSATSQQAEDFLTRIKSSSQFRERYQVSIDLNFYVAGFPQFRVIEAINDMNQELQTEISEMVESLKKHENNFGPSDTESAARHRVVGRIVSRLSDDLDALQNPHLNGLAEAELIELLSDLQRLQRIKNTTKLDYNTFF